MTAVNFEAREGGDIRYATGIHASPDALVETVVIGTAAASKAVVRKVPAYSRLMQIRMTFVSAITAVTAVKVGVGIAGNPDSIILSGTTLTAGTTTFGIPLTTQFVDAETEISVFACDTNGAAAGTIAGTVKIELIFIKMLDNA